jgi:hypothetical protein
VTNSLRYRTALLLSFAAMLFITEKVKPKPAETTGGTFSIAVHQQHTPKPHFAQGFAPHFLSRLDNFSSAIVKHTSIITPVRLSYLAATPEASNFIRRLYTRYLPRDPTL